MPPILKIESITTNPPLILTRLESGVTMFGRDTDNNIIIDSAAVSRRHASISEAGSQWVFRDFESTNGSWINSIQVSAGQIKLIRSGDTIRLADFSMRLIEEDTPEISTKQLCTLLLFNVDRFEREISLMDKGSRFVIGGPEGDMFIDGESRDAPQIVIVHFGDRVELTTGRSQQPIIINGLAATGTTALVDRDEIILGHIRIIVNDVASAQNSIVPHDYMVPTNRTSTQAYERPNLPAHLRKEDEGDGWESEAARRRMQVGRKFVFSSNPDGVQPTGTLALDAYEFGRSGFEMSSSQRFFSMIQSPDETLMSSLSEKVLIGVGVVVFTILIGFVGVVAFTLFGG
jgi:predicted component of type VI protein secretion system